MHDEMEERNKGFVDRNREYWYDIIILKDFCRTDRNEDIDSKWGIM